MIWGILFRTSLIYSFQVMSSSNLASGNGDLCLFNLLIIELSSSLHFAVHFLRWGDTKSPLLAMGAGERGLRYSSSRRTILCKSCITPLQKFFLNYMLGTCSASYFERLL